ncbi:MAG: cyclic nucleotide-binding domain-containing protein [Pseudomonadota bacterium]
MFINNNLIFLVNMKEELVQFIREHKIISMLSEDEAEKFVNACSCVRFPPDALVCEEDSVATHLYILYSGEMVVYTEDMGDYIEYARLKSGDFMCEISVISDKPTSASIKSIDQVELIAIGKKFIKELVASNQAFNDFLNRISIERFEENMEKQF